MLKILPDDMKINKIPLHQQNDAKMKMRLMHKILFTIHLKQAQRTQCVMHRLLTIYVFFSVVGVWCFENKPNGQMELF